MIFLLRLCFFILSLNIFGGLVYAYSANEAIRDAILHDPSLKASFEGVKMKNAQKGRAFSEFMPKISLNYIENKMYSGRSDISGDIIDQSMPRSRFLKLEQEIYAGFGSVSRFQASEAILRAEHAKYQFALGRVIADTILVYQRVIVARSKINVAQQKNDYFKAQLDESKIKLRAGVINLTDLAAAKFELADSEAFMASAKSELKAASQAFCSLIGCTKVPTNLKKIEFLDINIPDSLDKCNDIAYARNYQLRAMREYVQAARHNVVNSISKLHPNVSLSVRINHPYDKSPYVAGVSGGGAVALSVQVPIFQGGGEYSSIKEAKAEKRDRIYQLEKQILDISRSISDYWNKRAAAFSEIEAAKKLISARQTFADAMEAEFFIGSKTFAELLDAQTKLFDSKAKLLDCESNLVVNNVMLLELIGNIQELNLQSKK